MRITSTNIGERQEVQYRGKSVYTGIFKSPSNKPIFLGLEDVDKDVVVDRRYHGGVEKACYCYSKEAYSFWKKRYPELDTNYGMFGENLTIEGLKEQEIHLGDIWKIGEAEVQVSQPRQPCFKLGIRFNNQGILNQFIKAPYPGVYLKILKEGYVCEGDLVQVQTSQEQNPNLLATYRLLYDQEPTKKEVLNVLEYKDLPAPLREVFDLKLEKLA